MKELTRLTLRRKLERDEGHRRAMRESCTRYNPRPVIAMTDAEADEFAMCLAEDAQRTIRLRASDGSVRRMDNTETEAYAMAIKAAISYLNCRDAEHKTILQYRDACRREEADQQKARAELRKHNEDIVIHIRP